MIADANKLFPFFLPITIKISRKIRIFSASCMPKITETMAFCHSSSLIKSLRPLLWWQKVLYEPYSLIRSLCIKKIFLLLQPVYNDFVYFLYPFSRYVFAACNLCVVLIDIISIRRQYCLLFPQSRQPACLSFRSWY